MLNQLLVSLPLLAVGCINYSAVAHRDAVVELKCAEDEVQVEETGTSGPVTKFKAEGCGQKATYECWDDSQPASTPHEARRSHAVCSLVGSTMPRAPMSEGETQCRSQCNRAGESCRLGCEGGYCSTMCEQLAVGCIQGCLNALPRAATNAPADGL